MWAVPGGNLDFGDTSESFDISAFPLTIPGFSGKESSLLAGGQIGYNQQFGRFLVGIEADVDALSQRASDSAIWLFFPPEPLQIPDERITVRHSVETDLVGTINGRVGFTWQQLLLYASGGVAFVDLTVRANDLLEVPSFTAPGCCNEIGSGSDSGLAIGWAAGGGVAYAITNAISLGADYRHLAVEDDYNPRSNHSFSAQTHVRFTEDQVTLRVNLHLNAFFGR